MSSTPPAIQALARQLVAGEPARGEQAEGEANQMTRVCEKLRVPLSKLAGAAGFASLLSRALALAKRQAPSLIGLRVEADGSLTGFNEGAPNLQTLETLQHGGAILVAELLGLLITFIGEPLTLGLVREAWPNANFETTTPSTEQKL